MHYQFQNQPITSCLRRSAEPPSVHFRFRSATSCISYLRRWRGATKCLHNQRYHLWRYGPTDRLSHRLHLPCSRRHTKAQGRLKGNTVTMGVGLGSGWERGTMGKRAVNAECGIRLCWSEVVRSGRRSNRTTTTGRYLFDVFNVKRTVNSAVSQQDMKTTIFVFNTHTSLCINNTLIRAGTIRIFVWSRALLDIWPSTWFITWQCILKTQL